MTARSSACRAMVSDVIDSRESCSPFASTVSRICEALAADCAAAFAEAADWSASSYAVRTVDSASRAISERVLSVISRMDSLESSIVYAAARSSSVRSRTVTSCLISEPERSVSLSSAALSTMR